MGRCLFKTLFCPKELINLTTTNMTLGHQNTTKNAVKKHNKNMHYTCFPFLLLENVFFLYKTFDQTTTRNGFSSQNQIKTRSDIGCHFYLLEPFLRSFDLEVDISTLKMKLNHQNNIEMDYRVGYVKLVTFFTRKKVLHLFLAILLCWSLDFIIYFLKFKMTFNHQKIIFPKF